jgi:hypothetical protein
VETNDVLIAEVVEAVLPPTKFLSARKVPAAPPPALTDRSCARALRDAAEQSNATKESMSSERIALLRFFILPSSLIYLEIGLADGGLVRDEKREGPSSDWGKNVSAEANV